MLLLRDPEAVPHHLHGPVARPLHLVLRCVLFSPTATRFPRSSPYTHPPGRVFPAAVHFIFGAFLGVFAMGVQGGYLYTWVKGYTVVDARRRKQLRVSTATYMQARKVPFT